MTDLNVEVILDSKKKKSFQKLLWGMGDGGLGTVYDITWTVDEHYHVRWKGPINFLCSKLGMGYI